jgi:uncharacterized membrane protein YraQ (UPF0718 family)
MFPGGELSSMLIMLAAGIPMYVCASSSTPIAASLLSEGAFPWGAAALFLLSDQPTNATTITVMARSFGPALTAGLCRIHRGVFAAVRGSGQPPVCRSWF